MEQHKQYKQYDEAGRRRQGEFGESLLKRCFQGWHRQARLGQCHAQVSGLAADENGHVFGVGLAAQEDVNQVLAVDDDFLEIVETVVLSPRAFLNMRSIMLTLGPLNMSAVGGGQQINDLLRV